MITMGRVNHRFFLQRLNLHNAIIAETYSGSARLVFFHSFFFIYIDLIPLHSYFEKHWAHFRRCSLQNKLLKNELNSYPIYASI